MSLRRKVLLAFTIAVAAIGASAGVALAADGCACGGGGAGGAAAGGAAAAAGLVAGAAAGYGAAASTRELTGDCAQVLGAFNGLAAQRTEIRGRLDNGLRSLEGAYGSLRLQQSDERDLLSQRNQAFALLGSAALLSAGYMLKVSLVLARSYQAAAAVHARQAESARVLWNLYGAPSTWNLAAQESAGVALQNFAAARNVWNAGQAGAAGVGLAATIRAYLDGGMADYYASVERNRRMIGELEQACRNLDTQMHSLEARMDEMRPRLRECGVEPSKPNEPNLYWPSREPGPPRI